MVDEIYARLQHYRAGLALEVQTRAEEGVPERGAPREGVAEERELVLTALGDQALFPDLRALAAAAPKLAGWKVVAFKQAQGFEFAHSGALTLDPRRMWFTPLRRGDAPAGPLGLRVSFEFPAGREGEALDAVWKILATGLGEEALAARVAHVAVEALWGDPAELIPLSDLPAFLAWEQKRPGR